MPGDRVGRELARNVSTEGRVGEQTVEGAAGGPGEQRECDGDVGVEWGHWPGVTGGEGRS